MSEQLLSRRQFTARCAAFGLTLPALDPLLSAAQAPGADPAAKPAGRTVRLPDGTTVPAIGQGCWHLGQGRHPPEVEQDALRTGISLGLTLLDTSGNYGSGRSEELLSHVLGGERERIFLVSKVEPRDLGGDGIARACAASLARLGTDYLDLYLMHQPVSSDQLPPMVAAFEQLRREHKIRRWGVSNFSVQLMQDLLRVPDGHLCTTNQVPYSLRSRAIERELLPWCHAHDMPVMAYSPLGGDNNLVINDPTLARLAAAHGCAPAAVALAWVIRNGAVIAIPEAGSPAHVQQNAAAISLALTPEDLKTLEAAFSP
jgi:diketogulonate reductase-like aldo/keto reductase